MALVLNRDNNAQWIDRTDILTKIPANNFVLGNLGIFEDHYSSLKLIEIVRNNKNQGLLKDKNWDEKHQTVVSGDREYMQLKIPHFPASDAILPQDIDGVVAVNNMQEAMGLESVAAVRLEKMTTLIDSHGLTKEAARMQLITDGTVYAPNGTLRTSYGDTVNFYTEFGITRTEAAIDFLGTMDPRKDIEAQRKAVINGLNGTASFGAVRVVALCGSDYFDALVANPYVIDAVKYQQFNQSEPLLVGRPDEGAYGLSGIYRSITVFGVTFLDVGMAGYYTTGGTLVPFMGAKEARFLPVGARGVFKTYYAPAQRFGTINRQAQGSYFFEYANEKDDIIEIYSEQNFLNAMLYPAAVTRSYIS